VGCGRGLPRDLSCSDSQVIIHFSVRAARVRPLEFRTLPRECARLGNKSRYMLDAYAVMNYARLCGLHIRELDYMDGLHFATPSCSKQGAQLDAVSIAWTPSEGAGCTSPAVQFSFRFGNSAIYRFICLLGALQSLLHPSVSENPWHSEPPQAHHVRVSLRKP
jgi:hypothetical protein